MAKTLMGTIHHYKNKIESLEQEINTLQRISDKLIIARHVMALQEVVEDLEKLHDCRRNGESI